MAWLLCTLFSVFMHFQSARDIALDPASVSETVHDYVHGLVYSRCPSCSYFPCLCYVVSTLHIDVHNVISLTVFRFRCMKRCVQLEDDAVLSAQCQRFATLSLRDIGLQKNLQSSSEQPFLASIRLLQVRLRSLSRHPTTTCSTSSLPHPSPAFFFLKLTCRNPFVRVSCR